MELSVQYCRRDGLSSQAGRLGSARWILGDASSTETNVGVRAIGTNVEVLHKDKSYFNSSSFGGWPTFTFFCKGGDSCRRCRDLFGSAARILTAVVADITIPRNSQRFFARCEMSCRGCPLVPDSVLDTHGFGVDGFLAGYAF
jgi:hypothetical protein